MSEREADDPMRAVSTSMRPDPTTGLGTGSFAERNDTTGCGGRAAHRRVRRTLPTARVVDVACGTGFLTHILRGIADGA